MVQKTNTTPDSYENAVHHCYQVAAEAADLPEIPGRPDPQQEAWYLDAAGGDRILGGLYKSAVDNETALEDANKSHLEADPYTESMKSYALARWGLDLAIKKRRKEINDKT